MKGEMRQFTNKLNFIYLLMFCFCLVGCGSPDISLQHVKTKVVDLVPEPQTWSLDRFKHEW